jgi:transcription-repair coupling factor (superfamily II helicase)
MHPVIQKLKKHFSSTEGLVKLRSALPTTNEIAITGLLGSSKSLCAALLAEDRPLVIFARDEEAVSLLHDDIALLNEAAQPLVFEIRHGHTYADEQEVQREIMDAVVPLLSASARTIIISPASLGIFLPSPSVMQRSTFALHTGGLFERDDIVKKLVSHGYQRKDFVEEEGDIAVRGGIIDVFPFAQQQPLRIELQDIEIESIRSFDLLTQRSIRPVQEIIIPLGISTDTGDNVFASTVLDFVPADALIFMDEPDLVLGKIENEEYRTQLTEKLGQFTRISHSFTSKKSAVIDFGTRSQSRFGGAIKKLTADVTTKMTEGYTLDILAETNEHAKRLNELIEETDEEGTAPTIHVQTLALAEGFIFPNERWCVYTEHEVFERNRVSHRPQRQAFKGITIRELRKLQRGDFIVHVDKGIGRFAGLETIEIQGAKQECVKLIYRDSDILFVHLNHIDRLQKYVSKEGHVPHLSKLGTTEWARAKERMKARAAEIAEKLLEIHARRKVEKGFGFAADTRWQREMEASFMYDDTPDQASATQDVKKDMEAPNPMDRLVCGDVGYGKTEVAVRAAFKAVQDAKQVAVLVPTTILAQQHFNTFHDRLEKYAVRVAVLSRFRSKAEQKEILRELAAGNVDVVVGTHRILSKDVVFKDLGLLIIDEEQRFGVAAKERLREKRSSVDTLTLTATPIPRTMNLALVGLLDISVIETPPRNRRPIQTEIVQWSPDAIRNAIMYEIGRGGQCFVVHDHVQSIYQLVEKIQQIAPEARIAVAHGQMTGTALENVMMDFMMKKFDVLVCTKIVESGLDIPSVNTIMINKAENFGLAELYQLRGRVGRSNIQAYAYLLVPPLSVLSTQALKRLYALEEFTDLGSGFQLAMRDLELRGAGTILGGEQSGFIDALGFELYNQLLEQAVRDLKAREYKDIFKNELPEVSPVLRRDVQVQIGSDALIPQFYIPDDSERFEMYKRLYRADDVKALRRIRDELVDRFGALPPTVEALFRVVRLKNVAGILGFDKITERANELIFELNEQDGATDEFYTRIFPLLMKWVTEHAGISKVATKGNALKITVTLQGKDAAEIAEMMRDAITAPDKQAAAV